MADFIAGVIAVLTTAIFVLLTGIVSLFQYIGVIQPFSQGGMLLYMFGAPALIMFIIVCIIIFINSFLLFFYLTKLFLTLISNFCKMELNDKSLYSLSMVITPITMIIGVML